MVKCPNCGFENDDLAAFCKECLKMLPVVPLRNPSTPRVKPPLESDNSMRLFTPIPSGALRGDRGEAHPPLNPGYGPEPHRTPKGVQLS